MGTPESRSRHPLFPVAGDFSWPASDHPRHARIAGYLKAGTPVADSIFDKIYPEEIAERSERHWTPVRVAKEAANLLTEGSASRRILDVGAGCGKFCLVASLMAPGAFVGVERDERLIGVAREAAKRLGSPAKYALDDAFSVDWDFFDGFYFFNPFQESAETEAGSSDRFASVEATFARLSALRPQTRVVTYHGFGGGFPPGYDLVRNVPIGSDSLKLWLKKR